MLSTSQISPCIQILCMFLVKSTSSLLYMTTCIKIPTPVHIVNGMNLSFKQKLLGQTQKRGTSVGHEGRTPTSLEKLYVVKVIFEV